MSTNIEESLQQIWEAFKKDISQHETWSTMPIDDSSSSFFKAGIMYPNKQEAILIGFPISNVDLSLPKGKGFEVVKILNNSSLPGLWFALVKEISGNSELFLKMAADVYETCNRKDNLSNTELLQLFIHRINAWQLFMSSKRRLLSRESIIGLCGELEVLKLLLENKTDLWNEILDSWKGPFHGLQDFKINDNAIEVKSYVSGNGSPLINIDSESQLDPFNLNYLFLCACEFIQDENGITLTERIDSIKDILVNDKNASMKFENCLIAMGIFASEDNSELNNIYLKFKSFYCFLVDNNFPSLKKSDIAVALKNIRYQIQIDLIPDNFEIDSVFMLKNYFGEQYNAD